MQFSSRFTIATHILLCIALFSEKEKVTSDFLAGSISVNPVIVRNTLGLLSSAGLAGVRAGVGGAYLAKDADDITLLDIFRAVEKEEALFHFHENPNPLCPVGRTIHAIMDGRLESARQAMEAELSRTTLSRLVTELKERTGIE